MVKQELARLADELGFGECLLVRRPRGQILRLLGFATVFIVAGLVAFDIGIQGLSRPLPHSGGGLLFGPAAVLLGLWGIFSALLSKRWNRLLWCRYGVAIMAGDGTVSQSLRWSDVTRIRHRNRPDRPDDWISCDLMDDAGNKVTLEKPAFGKGVAEGVILTATRHMAPRRLHALTEAYGSGQDVLLGDLKVTAQGVGLYGRAWHRESRHRKVRYRMSGAFDWPEITRIRFESGRAPVLRLWIKGSANQDLAEDGILVTDLGDWGVVAGSFIEKVVEPMDLRVEMVRTGPKPVRPAGADAEIG